MEIDFQIVVDNMIKSTGLKTLTDIAGALEITPQTLNSHKKSGRLPKKHIINFSKKYAVPVEFLLTGSTRIVKEVVDKRLAQVGQGLPHDSFKKIGLRLGRLRGWVKDASDKLISGENASAIDAELEAIYNEMVTKSIALADQDTNKELALYKELAQKSSEIAEAQKEITEVHKENAELYEKNLETERKLNTFLEAKIEALKQGSGALGGKQSESLTTTINP